MFNLVIMTLKSLAEYAFSNCLQRKSAEIVPFSDFSCHQALSKAHGQGCDRRVDGQQTIRVGVVGDHQLLPDDPEQQG